MKLMMLKVTFLSFKHSVFNWWEDFVYPTLKLDEKMVTEPFNSGELLLPNLFLFCTNTSINSGRSLIRVYIFKREYLMNDAYWFRWIMHDGTLASSISNVKFYNQCQTLYCVASRWIVCIHNILYIIYYLYNTYIIHYSTACQINIVSGSATCNILEWIEPVIISKSTCCQIN